MVSMFDKREFSIEHQSNPGELEAWRREMVSHSHTAELKARHTHLSHGLRGLQAVAQDKRCAGSDNE
jgi:hypothetical protein